MRITVTTACPLASLTVVAEFAKRVAVPAASLSRPLEDFHRDPRLVVV